MSRSSRYDPARPFEPRPDGTVPFDGVLPRIVPTPVGVIEHVVVEGDRLDALAQEYYNDSRLWWHILDANPQIECGADLADPDLFASAGAADPARRPALRPNLVGATIVIPAPPTRGA